MISLATSPPWEGDRTGEVIATIGGEPYFRISNVGDMPPFLMSVVSDTNLWLFVGSNGGFTAGRTDPDQAIFPYQTVDKILSCPESAGALSIFHVEDSAGAGLWEPWRGDPVPGVQRNLYKHACGTSVIFEEIRGGLRFRWTLEVSAKFGLIRRCSLANVSETNIFVRYLDGFHRLLPAGVSEALYTRYSYLVCAYMRHERTGQLGLFTLNSGVSDRAEPCESLRAACAWSLGHPDPAFLISDRQVSAFRAGKAVISESDVRGEFGAFLAMAAVGIPAGTEHHWISAADTGLHHSSVLGLVGSLRDEVELEANLEADLMAGRQSLRRRAADGLQLTAQPDMDAHHFANTIFNCMRGGVPENGYQFPSSDFADFLRSRNRPLASRLEIWLESLPEELDMETLHELSSLTGDAQLSRLAGEYLPLIFSRRHGDPSRPWNRFSIRLKNEDGRPALGYQGNWRDIFQNWEGLARSYPGLLENMIAVFLNASTADGYNPYRITRDGIEWEVSDPEDPWSQIGYWGDHQIVYLSRLLESLENLKPGQLTAGLEKRLYSCTVVPYEIAGWDGLLKDPRHSIRFDLELHRKLTALADQIGNDGKLLADANGSPFLFSLAEKLLVPVMTKLSNLVPGGGIWLNTQRPEWNDANNALAGWGLSVVTVFNLRRHLKLLQTLFAGASDELPISVPSSALLRELSITLSSCPTHLEELTDDALRLSLSRRLGLAGGNHREAVYSRCCPDMTTVSAQEVIGFLNVALRVVEATLEVSFREDGLAHSYNMLSVDAGGAHVSNLDLMLEGQVAALGSGFLHPADAVRLLESLKVSALYRRDQNSYMLQPDREIPSFLSRNRIPRELAARSVLIQQLVASCERSLVLEGAEGGLHFHPDLTNASDLDQRLDTLAARPEFSKQVETDRGLLHQIWEAVFHHSAFLGRSGTIFAFEGLGSIYWHMISKLLLSVQECHRACEDPELKIPLAFAYRDIRNGLGFRKSAEVYGAFPTDPYSHTPAHRGAQQPGMTGQVKEEILTRLGELGVEIREGRVHFHPCLMESSEFLKDAGAWSYFDVNGNEREMILPPQSLGFTVCQIPVVYEQKLRPGIIVEWADGHSEEIAGRSLPQRISREIFSRSGRIFRLLVGCADLRFA